MIKRVDNPNHHNTALCAVFETEGNYFVRLDGYDFLFSKDDLIELRDRINKVLP